VLAIFFENKILLFSQKIKTLFSQKIRRFILRSNYIRGAFITGDRCAAYEVRYTMSASNRTSSFSTPTVESQLWGWEAFFQELDCFLRASGRQLGQCEESYASHVIERLEVFTISLTRLKEHLQHSHGQIAEQYRPTVLGYVREMTQLIVYLRSLAREWQSYIDAKERLSESLKYQASLSRSTGKGRPRFSILKEQLEFLRSLCFTWSEIAQLIGVSRMTIYRRREEFGMLEEPTATLTDSELKQKISEIRKILPEVGEKIIQGQLRSMGYQIPRCRVRESLQFIDPVNTALRWPGGVTARRQYSVPGPNSLWHIGKYL